MQVLIMGSGGVGGFIGSRLLQTGHHVTFVARGPHLQAIRDHGLCMVSETGTRHVHHVTAVERPEEANAQFDLVIFAVKCYDTQPAAQLLRPALNDQTAVLTLQNGIDSVPTLSSILGPQHVIGGATWLTAHILEPGVIEYQDAEVRAAIGEPAGGISDRVQTIGRALRTAGIETEVSADIDHVLWNKLVLLAVLGPVTAACQLPLGPILATEGMLDLFRTMFNEAIAVNLTAVWLGMRFGIPLIEASGGGSIISTSSIGALQGIPTTGPYSAAKYGAHALTRTCAAEVASKNIRVNCIIPGAITTRFALPSDAEQTEEDLQARRERGARISPMARSGNPEEIATLALFLACDDSSFITGQCIAADGGMTSVNGWIQDRG